MRAWILAILAAVVLHGLILLFGGVFFMKSEDEAQAVIEEVDLLTDESKPEDETDTPEEITAAETLEVEEEAPPPMPEMTEPTPQVEPTDVVARLDALSLSALEGALDPSADGDAFGGTTNLTSGGRIGGTGAPGAVGGLEGSGEDAIFDLAALDERPRVLHQVPPSYPPELRRQKVEGTVVVVFFVDRDGRVLQPMVEASPHEAFVQPALEAVRRWKFAAGVVHGEKVRTKMRVPIRFSVSS